MRKLLLLVALTACATQPAPTPTPTAPVPASALNDDDAGKSPQTAVAVPADAPNEGVDFENDWLFSRYGRFRKTGGGTGTLQGRRYDMVQIELPSGEKKQVFFDITENWAKWNPQ